MTAALHEHALPEIADLVTVVPSAPGTSAQLYGAAELGLADFLREPLDAAGTPRRRPTRSSGRGASRSAPSG
jgi:hypothetical protein